MARNIIKSNIAAIASQDTTEAWSTVNESVALYKLAQSFDYSVSFPRQDLKQLGNQELVYDGIFQQPDVQLNISYIPEPNFSNEVRGRFIDSTSSWTSEFKNMFDTTDSTNLYVFVSENQTDDFLDKITFYSSLNLSGSSAIAFGNCYPTSYSLNYGIGTLPIVSTSYICSNAVFDNLTGTSMEMPAINLTGGNNDNVGRCDFTFAIDLSSASLEKKPPLVNPTDADSSITLQNLQVGGQNISGLHLVQSVGMSVELPRVSNYGLGSDFAFGRKPQFPAKGSFNVSSLVSGFESGTITGVLNNDENYDFQLVLASGSKKMIYQIEDAKLTSYNYSMPVNNQMAFDAEFSFEVTETKGLKISGTYY